MNNILVKIRKYAVSVIYVSMAALFIDSSLLFAQAHWGKRLWGKIRQRKPVYQNYVKSNYERMSIVGDIPNFGMYDPSVEYDDDGVGWLAYTSATDLSVHDLDTYLAKSTDGGKTWLYTSHISESKKVAIEYKGKQVEVVQRYETPSLLFDPSDPDENGRWKLFLVSGFSLDGTVNKSIWQKAFIVLKQAITPQELSGAKETILFASELLPSGYAAKYNLDDFSYDLKNTVFYQEPGSLIHKGIIYLTLNTVSWGGQKTILLCSLDHGISWEYVGILINNTEIINPKYPVFTSSALAEEKGRLFLFVSSRKRGNPGNYNGVSIFEFEDTTKGRLKRGDNGKLIVYKYIPPVSKENVGGGQSEYHSGNTYGGIIMSQSFSDVAVNERFQIFSTKEKILDK